MYATSHKNMLRTQRDKRATEGRRMGDKEATRGRQNRFILSLKKGLSRRLRDGVSVLTLS
jgi:hypothetical protein